MYPYRRNAVPRRLSWDLTDGVVARFYWLGVAKPASKQAIDAEFGAEFLTAAAGQSQVRAGVPFQ